MSDSDIVIRAEGLGKKYLIGHQADREPYVALRDVIVGSGKNIVRKAANLLRGREIIQGDHIEEFWALQDVNCEIRRGEVVGIIGRNGAGKSTLLKVLSRVTEPSAGRVTLKGRVASLLEVGTGFHPELTGRENIFLNGAILGMTRAEIKRKFDEIVAFAEVERFLDTPVKRYSSGMYVRLAFAVAANLEPEILIVDEVLAVGDAEFQKKCLGKMNDVANTGRTVLFVSHNMGAVESLCERCILLERGKVRMQGTTAEVMGEYVKNRSPRLENSGSVRIHGDLSINGLSLSPNDIRTHERVQITVSFKAEAAGQFRECALLFYSAKGVRVAIFDTRDTANLPYSYSAGVFELVVTIEALPLIEGDYSVGLYVVADKFAGDLAGLEDFTVLPPSASGRNAPYPVEHRGLLEFRADSSIAPAKDRGTTR